MSFATALRLFLSCHDEAETTVDELTHDYCVDPESRKHLYDIALHSGIAFELGTIEDPITRMALQEFFSEREKLLAVLSASAHLWK